MGSFEVGGFRNQFSETLTTAPLCCLEEWGLAWFILVADPRQNRGDDWPWHGENRMAWIAWIAKGSWDAGVLLSLAASAAPSWNSHSRTTLPSRQASQAPLISTAPLTVLSQLQEDLSAQQREDFVPPTG